jgi:hypothetical protein
MRPCFGLHAQPSRDLLAKAYLNRTNEAIQKHERLRGKSRKSNSKERSVSDYSTRISLAVGEPLHRVSTKWHEVCSLGLQRFQLCDTCHILGES